MNFVYDFCRCVGVIMGYPFRWLVFKDKIYYENDNASRRVKGGALIITNHFNTWDFVMNVFVFFPRKLYVVASEHAFKNFMIRLGMKFWGGIKADRVSKSPRFVAQSIREIKNGHLVQIFPEGHNTDDGNIQPFYPSYIVIAQRAGAPIIPVITDGNYGLFKRVHLMVGEPIDLSQHITAKRASKEEILEANEMVYQKVLALRAELDARIKAGRKKRANV